MVMLSVESCAARDFPQEICHRMNCSLQMIQIALNPPWAPSHEDWNRIDLAVWPGPGGGL